MNYIVILANRDGSKELFWFNDEAEAKEYVSRVRTDGYYRVLQIISTADNKHY